MKYAVPGVGDIELQTIILDLNGTVTVGGAVPEGTREKLAAVKNLGFQTVFFTGNTRNNADQLAKELGIGWQLASTAEEKRDLALQMHPETCVSIGNGQIDLELTKAVQLSIVTLQAEGVHTETLLAADIVVPTIIDALDLLIDPDRLIATLRK